MYANNVSANAVLDKLEKLTGSAQQRSQDSSCAEVINKTASLIKLINTSVSDPSISIISHEIFCSTVSCSPKEITEFSQVLLRLKEAVQNINVTLSATINKLQGGNIISTLRIFIPFKKKLFSIKWYYSFFYIYSIWMSCKYHDGSSTNAYNHRGSIKTTNHKGSSKTINHRGYIHNCIINGGSNKYVCFHKINIYHYIIINYDFCRINRRGKDI